MIRCFLVLNFIGFIYAQGGGNALDFDGSDDYVEKNPFEKFKNVIFTNHLAGITTDNLRRFDLLEKNLKNYINKEFLINTVDINKQY